MVWVPVGVAMTAVANIIVVMTAAALASQMVLGANISKASSAMRTTLTISK